MDNPFFNRSRSGCLSFYDGENKISSKEMERYFLVELLTLAFKFSSKVKEFLRADCWLSWFFI